MILKMTPILSRPQCKNPRVLMTSSNENVFRVAGPLCGHRWIPLTKASDAELWCSLWSAPWINGCVNNGEAGDLRRHRAEYDVIVMISAKHFRTINTSHVGQNTWRGYQSDIFWGTYVYSGIMRYRFWTINTQQTIKVFTNIIPLIITMTSEWARWRLKSPASRLFTQPFIQRKHQSSAFMLLCGEFTGDRWIPPTKGK